MNANQIAQLALTAPMSAAIATVKNLINPNEVIVNMHYAASPDMPEDTFQSLVQGFESLVDCQAVKMLATAD